jgi:hypothetical protein
MTVNFFTLFIADLLMTIDGTIQYGEDADVKIRYPEEND